MEYDENVMIRIRKFKEEDANMASVVVKRSLRSIVSHGHSKQSIEDQIKCNSPKRMRERSQYVQYFVAIEENSIVGIGGYDHQKVHTFFVEPNRQGKGIGKALMKKVLAEAKKKGIPSLICWSTFPAVPFYSRLGFKPTRKIRVRGLRRLI